jgi:hypothetical protein
MMIKVNPLKFTNKIDLSSNEDKEYQTKKKLLPQGEDFTGKGCRHTRRPWSWWILIE